ncbi:MAG: PIG-L family deacetylase [Chloroflexi bacterium]|nr:MAG: PIG-L family deacetylase [Chloroflexota bacterium]
MQIVEPPRVERIMAIAAHPDDIESWCAGTLALAVDAGASARLLLVTSGELGSHDLDVKPTFVGMQREAEALAAAQRLGIAEVAFLRHPDGDTENTRELRRSLVEWIRRWQPDVLFTHDPEHAYPPYLAHRDHRCVGRAALDAAFPLARARLAFAEQQLEPHTVNAVWLFASDAADAFVDISASFERKLAARLAHASQTPDPSVLRASWRERAATIGAPVALTCAEAFRVLNV